MPLVVNDYSSFVDADRPARVRPFSRKVFLRNANAFSQTPRVPHSAVGASNLIREIIALFEAIGKLADDASGFNRNMLGSGNFAGAARTATGLMQIQEAASIIATFVIGNVDATAIIPMLNKVIAYINRNHPDKRCKGDAQIIARGQLSKVMRSAQQQVVSAGFQAMMTPPMPQLLGPEKLLIALREYLKNTESRTPTRSSRDEDRQAFLAPWRMPNASAALLRR